MKSYQDFSDSRHDNGCIFCSNLPNSRDHIPARTFLIKPYSSNLHTLPVCKVCNNKLSKDEEYVSFLIGYLKHLETGDLDEYLQTRKYSHADILEDRILNGMGLDSSEPNFSPFINIETERIKKVLQKYAFAHFCFERGEHPSGEILQTNFAFANQLTKCQIKEFNKIPDVEILPEVGSRLFQRIIESGSSWMIIQDGQYRYYVSPNQPYVRIVFSELLMAEIIFSDY